MGSFGAPELLLILVFLFFIYIIAVLIARWVFKIETIVDYQKKQYLMLRQIAHKLNVDEDMIRNIDNPHSTK